MTSAASRRFQQDDLLLKPDQQWNDEIAKSLKRQALARKRRIPLGSRLTRRLPEAEATAPGGDSLTQHDASGGEPLLALPAPLKLGDIEVGRSFVAKMEWEGYISEIDGNKLIAVMRDVERPNEAEKIFTVPIEAVPAIERDHISLGAVFRLSTGVELNRKLSIKSGRISTQSRNDVRIYFRRALFKSRDEIRALKAGLSKIVGPSLESQ